MSDCIDQDFPCQNPEYDEFDRITKDEIKNAISLNSFINQSEYCNYVLTNDLEKIGDMSTSLFLKPLHNKFGVYHLWEDYEHCDTHNTYTMRCLYVGKGPPTTRVPTHIKTKWPHNKTLYVTFQSCKNRLAKYYEQLFLDIFHFNFNVSENKGKKILYAVWDEDRYLIGTHLNEISSHSKMKSPDDW